MKFRKSTISKIQNIQIQRSKIQTSTVHNNSKFKTIKKNQKDQRIENYKNLEIQRISKFQKKINDDEIRHKMIENRKG